jgi:hypothetical protein
MLKWPGCAMSVAQCIREEGCVASRLFDDRRYEPEDKKEKKQGCYVRRG